MNILITGAAGFIGSILIDRFLSLGYSVSGIDNFDSFYPRQIKENNIAHQLSNLNYTLLEADITDADTIKEALKDLSFDTIIHLDARAGVRPSIEDPEGYFRTNVIGTLNMLELARNKGIKKFIFAPSSSVYGNNPNVPWREDELNLRKD